MYVLAPEVSIGTERLFSNAKRMPSTIDLFVSPERNGFATQCLKRCDKINKRDGSKEIMSVLLIISSSILS
jgi:hypothetical protein